MTDFKIDFGSAQGNVEQIRSINRSIQEGLNTLEVEIEKDLAEWESDGAKQAYWQAKKRRDEAAANMNHVLGQAGGTLENVVDVYKRADNGAQSNWQR